MNYLELVIPTIPVDLEQCISSIKYFFEFLPIKEIIFIGNKNVEKRLGELNDSRLRFIDENSIYEIEHIKEIIRENSNGNEDAVSKSGWYYQQFLKICYSKQCKNSHYLIWDSDTIPLHKIFMFDENKNPIFDMKTEYHKPYFNTIGRLFQGMKKIMKKSFISEHMLFDTASVNDMIREVENNNKLPGNDFCEKVLLSIEADEYTKLSFSEFETYGTYVYSTQIQQSQNSGGYRLRDWKSLRRGAWYFEKEQLDEDLVKWLSKYYDAISFEKGSVKKKIPANIIKHRIVRKMINAHMFEMFHRVYYTLGRAIMRFIRRIN